MHPLLSTVSCRLLAGASPLECAVPLFRALSALECALAKRGLRKSFRMRSYKKSGEGVSMEADAILISIRGVAPGGEPHQAVDRVTQDQHSQG